jgi:hypothetical protein
MRQSRLLHVVLVSLCFARSPSFGSTPAVTVSVSAYGCSGSPVLVGWEFTVARPVAVSSLGLYTSSPYAPFVLSPTAGLLGLWEDSNGTLLASCDVADTDPVSNDFKYHDITSSGLILSPGLHYTVALLIPDSRGWVYAQGGYQCADEINFVSPRFDYSYYGLQRPLAAEMGGLGASFTYTVVPEPAVDARLVLAAGFFVQKRLFSRAPNARE